MTPTMPSPDDDPFFGPGLWRSLYERHGPPPRVHRPRTWRPTMVRWRRHTKPKPMTLRAWLDQKLWLDQKFEMPND